MYEKIEQAENVARGHVEVTEIIAYDFDRMEKVIDEYTGEDTGREKKVEKSRGPYFCQTKEQERIFGENNSKARIESFTIQLLESTAIEYMDRPENIKQFTKPEAASVQTLEEPEPNWRQQAKQLGIPLNKETGGSRKKEDVLMDIIAQTTVSTN